MQKFMSDFRQSYGKVGGLESGFCVKAANDLDGRMKRFTLGFAEKQHRNR
jgi:hypothetical protein